MTHKSEPQPDLMDRRFRVVAAFISQNGKVLLTQRWPGKHQGNMWEFPGGKVELNETDEEALKRELKEELDIEVQVGSCCFETYHGYGNREVHLLIYRCELLSGSPHPIDVKALDWAEEHSLLQRNFPPADLPFVQEIVAGRMKHQENSEEDGMPPFKPAQVIRKPSPPTSSGH